jgi:hypothetical protein
VWNRNGKKEEGKGKDEGRGLIGHAKLTQTSKIFPFVEVVQ